MTNMKNFLSGIADAVEEKVKSQRSRVNFAENLGPGADGTQTMLIDSIAEEVCINAVKEGDFDLNILSEEKGFIDNSAERTLVLDPIDGTHNAIRGIPFFSISLAVGYNKISDVEIGLVRNLVTGDTYWAEKGKGAFLGDKPIQTRKFEQGDELFSIYIGERATEKSYKVARIPRRARHLGSASLEMCLLASGALDAYYLSYNPKRGGMRVIDIAASCLILREAGGEVYNEDFRILDMDYDLNKRTSVIAVGDKQILKYLTSITRVGEKG